MVSVQLYGIARIMKFKELLEDVSWQEVEESLVKLHVENLENYYKVFFTLFTLEPSSSDMRICIKLIPPDDDDPSYWEVLGKNGTLHKDTEDVKLFPDATIEFMDSEVEYAIEFRKWEEWLGMEIDENTANNINLMKADIVALVLKEMTYFGYEQEKIKETLDMLKERAEKYKNMSEEELKKNSSSLEEVKKRIDKIIKDKKVDGECEK